MTDMKASTDRCLKILLGSDEHVAQWWERPNHTLYGRKPIDLWKEDRHAIVRYVLGALSGKYRSRRERW